MIIKFFKKHIWLIIGALTGLGAGYFYWLEAGCISGSCTITSSPVNATLYGGLMGVLVFSFLKDLLVKPAQG